jgi:hypothetical protein
VGAENIFLERVWIQDEARMSRNNVLSSGEALAGWWRRKRNADISPRHSGGCDFCDQITESRAELTKFLKMDGGQAFDHLLAVAGEVQLHTATIGGRRRTSEEPPAYEAVNQPDRAMMANLQAIREFRDESVVASGKTL